LPSAAPFIANAIRVNAPAALIIAVVAGLFGGAPGIGYLLYRAVQTVDAPTIFALVIIMGTIGILFQFGSAALEKWLLPWSPAIRRGAAA
jgi:ABC-type nitrate/sulfonate/bicarbonate transport system permease component